MTHPYLADPERAAAFAYLVANPGGSERRWAQALRWTPSKFHRFMQALVRFRLGEVTTTAYGSTFRPLTEVVTPIAPDPSAKQKRSTSEAQPEQIRSAAGTPHLEALDTGYLVSRCVKMPAGKGGNAEAMTCIGVVNEVLGSNFGACFAPISHDNHGSHHAVQQWIAAGMPLEAMTRLLRAKAMVFNPSKINGDMPRSLGFFTKWILKEWAIEKRQLPLPLMTYERQAPAPRTKMDKPAALGDVMADVAAQLGVQR